MRKLAFLLIGLMLVSNVFAEDKDITGKTFIKSNPDIEVDYENEKFLIAPAYMWGMGGTKNELAASLILFGSMTAKFGDRAISLEPLSAPLAASGLDWMFYRLISGARHMILWHGTWDPNEDASAHGGTSELTEVLDKLGDLIALIGEKVPAAEGIRYMVLLEVGCVGDKIPILWAYRSKAVVYDLETGTFVKYIEIKQKTFANYNAAKAAIPGVANKLYKALLAEDSKDK